MVPCYSAGCFRSINQLGLALQCSYFSLLIMSAPSVLWDLSDHLSLLELSGTIVCAKFKWLGKTFPFF